MARRSRRRHGARPWYHHPFQLFYLGVIGLGVLALQSILSYLLTLNNPNSYNFSDTLIGKAAIQSPLIFWPIAAAALVVAGIGWWFDTHSDDEPGDRELPFAKDLRATNFKLGDDVAAESRMPGPQLEASPQPPLDRVAILNSSDDNSSGPGRNFQFNPNLHSSLDLSIMF